MRKYELMCILNSEQESVEDHVKFVEETFSANGINIAEQKDMGQKDLAYPIQDLKTGRYYLYQIETEQTNLDEMEKAFKLYKGLLRYLVLRKS